MFNGYNRILYIEVGDVGNLSFIPIACLTSNDFNESTDTLATTTRANNGWKTSVPINQSFNVSFEGIQISTAFNDVQKASYDRLKAIKRTRQVNNFKIENLDGTQQELFSGIIISLSESASVDDLVTFSGQIEGVNFPESIPDPVDDLDTWEFEDGQTMTTESNETLILE